MDWETIIALSVKHHATDLHLCSGVFPVWRCDGVPGVIPDLPVVKHASLEEMCFPYLDEEQRKKLSKEGHVDFAINITGTCRFRANLFYQHQGLSLALRHIPNICPDLDALRLPACVPGLLQKPDGLLLVTGATGSGKSTTLTAMVNALNQQQALHILTLEDPIEFIHKNYRSLIQQREIGQHCQTFSGGLRAALREDPDVILLGELRDNETIRLALTAAETGHLVLATLHTRSATQAIERLVDTFPAEEKNAVRCQLAGNLHAVIAQRLVPARSGGRIGVFEILINTPAVANLIREGKTHQLPSILQTGIQSGMQTFEQGVSERQRQGLIA